MNDPATVVKLEVPLQTLANRILAAEQREARGGQERIEALIEKGVAFLEARERFANDREFGRWIKTNRIATRPNDRSAIIHLARDVALMRKAFTDSRYQSPEYVWQEAKPMYTAAGIHTKSRRGRKKKDPTMKTPPMTVLHRQVKLEGIYERIHNTSLGAPKEMDALINLMEANPEMANKLVERATSGEAVSAVAACNELDRMPRASSAELIGVWTNYSQRLLAAWLRASDAEQDAFIKYLEEHRHA